MNDNDSSNYFVLNQYSQLWDGKLFPKEGFVSLQADESFTLKKRIDIPLRLSDFDASLYNADETISVIPDQIISFDIDEYDLLYFLDKNSKKIRRLSLYDYEHLDDNFSTEYPSSDEYVAVCKGLNNPKTVSVSKNYIYVLENSVIYILSKTNNRLIKTIRFNDEVNIFKVTDDEKIIFYSYSDDKTVLLKRNLAWEIASEDDNDSEEEDRIINLSDNVILDQTIEGNLSTRVSGSEGRNYQKDVGGRGYEDYGPNKDFYSNNEKYIRNIIDIAINTNNGLKILYVLTYGELYAFDFDGNQFGNAVKLKDENEEYDPTSLALDEVNNEIFIGNVTKDDHQAFPRKLPLQYCPIKPSPDAKQKNDKRPRPEKMRFQGQSRKVFFTRVNEAGKSLRRLLIFNILKEKNWNTTEDNSSNNTIPNVSKDDNDDDDSKALGVNYDSGSLKNISCDILEESAIYKSGSVVTLASKSLDTVNSNTRWFKVAMEFDAPTNTFVKLSYLCFNDEVPNIETGNWISGPVNSKNVLILDCVGRYLKLKVELSSLDERNSPKFYKMTAYFSVPTYMRYLPYIYQEDEQSKDFLERFLAIFQTLFEDTQGKIFSFANFLDVRTTPDEFLPWLASWMSIGQSEDWNSESMRSLLERAPVIFRKRGTKEGLEEMLSIYLQIVGKEDNAQGLSSLGQRPENGNKIQAGNPITSQDSYSETTNSFFIIDGKKELNQLFGILEEQIGNYKPEALLPFCFYVLLNPLQVDDGKVYFLKRLVAKEKPAYTVGVVRRLPKLWILGKGNFLGVNTLIRKRISYVLGENFILGKSYLNFEPLLTHSDKQR